MSDEPSKPKASSWLTFFIIIGTVFAVFALLRPFDSPKALVPPVPSGGEHNAEHKVPPPPQRLQIVAKKALLIAIDEVKKREGWSSNPDWANIVSGEAGVWEVTVRRKPRSSVGARHVFVNSVTGEVERYD
jgi:hypothetical protein